MKKGEFTWESLTALGTLILAVGTLITVIVMTVQVMDARDMDRTKNLIDLRKEFDSSEFASVRQSLAAKRLDRNGHLIPWKSNEAPPEAYEILNFFDSVGMLLDKGHLNADDVWEQMSYWISNYSEDFKNVIAEEEKYDPYAYSDFKKLAQEIYKISEQKYKQPLSIPQDDLEDFYHYELKNPLVSSPKPKPHK
ncbi:MAG TPA: hypothetical protein VGK24_06170 [Candidatus Angelobacter sp.]|jgi:hypothetical protein